MTASTETTDPASIDARFYRRSIQPVPLRPLDPAECGFTTYARVLAMTICATLGATTWQAQTRTPYWPHPRVDQRNDIAIVVDHRHLVTVTWQTPAGTTRDQWMIRLGGRLLPHRVFAREYPNAAEHLARSLWRHLNAVVVAPCDTSDCSAPATVATGDARSRCLPCAQQSPGPGW